MEINWFTFFAQILNFLVLVWLLKRFLYKPVLNTIDQRERNINAQLMDAAERVATATEEKEAFQKKNEQFDRERKELMDKVIVETNMTRDRLIEEARNEAVEYKMKLDKTLEELKEGLKQELALKTQQEVFAIARKTLDFLASITLEEHIVNVFVDKLQSLNDAQRDEFTHALNTKLTNVVIQSAFELSSLQTSKIQQVINKSFGDIAQVEFKINTNLIGGINLKANGYVLSWNIAEFINSYETCVADSSNVEPT